MKTKKIVLVALAGLAAGSVMAQTNVTVSGTVDMFAGSMRYAGQNGSTATVGSGGMTTSWFGFKGSEDLGGGLKADFALTGFFRGNTGQSGRFGPAGVDPLFSRDANVGLSGSFGAVSLGRGLAPNFLPTVLFNPFGDSFTFSPLVLHLDVPVSYAAGGTGWPGSLAGDTGWSNQIRYTTPNFGGLTANLHYQFGNVAGDNGTKNIGGNLLYFKGPLALTAFYHNVKVNNPLGAVGNVQLNAAEQKAWMLGGSYDLQVAKLFLTYGQTSHDIDLKDKTWSLGASAPIGPGRLLAGWAQTKRSGAAIGPDVKRDTVTVGYDYDLSKRTDLYAMLMNDRITNQNSGNSFGVGIRHRF